MTTSRQRRKQKSSSNGPSRRSKKSQQKRIKRVAEIQGPEVLRKNWDKKLTVRQNYEKLGLAGNLSFRDSGGDVGGANKSNNQDLHSDRVGGAATIERDEQGNIISINEHQPKSRVKTVWGEALNDESDDDNNESNHGSAANDHTAASTTIVAELEESAKTAAPIERFLSTEEYAWLVKLIKKHGTDIESMSRDRQDNVWQKTTGEIRRAIKKAGGFDAFL